MKNRESLQHYNGLAISLVESIRGVVSYSLQLHDLDDIIFGSVYESVVLGQNTIEDADLIYGAFVRIYLQE